MSRNNKHPSPPPSRAVHRNPNLVAKQAAEQGGPVNPLLSRLYSSSVANPSGQVGVPNILAQNAKRGEAVVADVESSTLKKPHDTLQLYQRPEQKSDDLRKTLTAVSHHKALTIPTKGAVSDALVPAGHFEEPEHQQLSQTGTSQPSSIVTRFRNSTSNSPKEFIYLSVRPVGPRDMYNPYDLQLSSHKEINPAHYFTVSGAGVTKFDNGEAEFMELKAWEREHRIFHQLIQLNVFNAYKKWKGFFVWRQLVRRTTIQLYKNHLNDNLFHLHPNLSGTLRDVRRICLDFLRHHNLYSGASETKTLDQFCGGLASHLSFQRGELEAMIKRIRDEIERACKAAMLTATAAREKELKTGLEPSDDPRRRRKGVEYRDGASTHKPSYIELSQKRAVCRRLTAFIRLCDYVVINALAALAMKALRDLHGDLQFPRTRSFVEEVDDKGKPEEKKKGAKKDEAKGPFMGMVFNCDILYSIEDELIHVKPSSTSFAQKVDELVKEYLKTVSTIPRFAQMEVFRTYTEHGFADNGEGEGGMGPDVGEMVTAEDEYKSLTLSLRSSLASSFGAVEKYAREFEPFRMMHLRNSRLNTDEIKRNNEPLDFFRDRLALYKQQSEDIEHKIPNSKNVALFTVHTDALRDFFTPSPLDCLKAFHDLLPVIAHEKNENMLADMNSCNRILDDDPQTVEQYVGFMSYVSGLENRLEAINHEFEFLHELFTLLGDEKVHISETDDETYRSGTRPQYEKMRTHMQLIEDNKESQQRHFAKNIDEQMDALKVRIAEVAVKAKNPLLEDQNANREHVLAVVDQLTEEAQAIALREKELRRFQVSFSLDETPIDTLEDMTMEVTTKARLWSSIQSWDALIAEYVDVPFKSLDTPEVQDQINKYTTTVKQVTSKLPNNPAVQKFRQNVDEWRMMSPVIVALKNPKIDGHNKQRLEQIIGTITDPNGNERTISEYPDFTLSMLMAKGVFASVGDEIIAISRTATEEDKLEQALQRVHTKWVSGTPAKPAMEFAVNNHKDIKDLYVLSGISVEEITAELEESSIQVSTISSSKYCTGLLREKVDRWDRNLKQLQETLDKWLEFQRNWIYLENIFSSPEIRNQWKEDAHIFHGVDTQFRARMRRVHDAPNVFRSIIVDETKSAPLLEIFEKDNKKLEQVLASLEKKLEKKRRSFPRFYFLSNDDLLDILAKIKQPEQIMSHMLKMFDGIKTLSFSQTNDITHLHSMEGEKVELIHKNIKAGRGQVEVWLNALEAEMFLTLRTLAKGCFEDFHARNDRLSWIFQHPVQLVLIMSQMFWTRNVEEALDKDNSRELMAEVREKNYRELGELAGLTGRKLSKVQRCVLSTLITLDVHGRDLVDEMYDNEVTKLSEFGWTKQLRVYWEQDDDGAGNVFIRQNNSRFVYGYEYLGAQGRLVITPLTDRVYMTITGALKLYLGAAPAGPAGTGKTETTKDLAKNLARQCIVYNCSDGVTYKMMEKFFSGLIQTGAWTCLDEFNRINIEVLSVIASQVLEIKLALQSKQESFTFQGTPDVRIRTTYGVFITMNPGYAGRTELPDNLKILFRPVAVMTPDFRMIAEVILYSEGFNNAKDLSLKITQLYKLSSEQLSPQDHYDFGMRALKSILVMAGDLKRSQPDVEEDLTLIVACNDSNLPKFVAEDIPLFRGIMTDLFPGVKFPEREYDELYPAMMKDMDEKSLIEIDSWVKKGIQFYETLIVRHGVMLVGATGTGKTETRNCIANALNTMAQNESENPMARNVNQFVINPKSIMMHELYGILDVMTNEWRDGVLAVIAKNCVRASEGSNEHRWIVFDGPVDTLWIESLNSVLDDSKLLCLDSGERIKLPDTIHMLFEVQDLAVASPATVSRCGMVYVDTDDLPWEALLGKWAKTQLSQHAQPQCLEFIVSLFQRFVPEGVDWFEKHSVLISGGTMNVVQSCLDLFTAMIRSEKLNLMADPVGETVIPPDDALFRERNEMCGLLFSFSFIWSFGGNVDSAQQDSFDTFTRDLLENIVRFPNHDTLYDFFPEFATRQFVRWDTKMSLFKYEPGVAFFDILVPTVDTVRFSYLTKVLLQNEKPVLFSGQTGVGKSVIMTDCLMSNKDTLSLAVVVFQFSAQTSAERTQELIESKLKAKRKHILGAPPGRKVVLFIDDLNMPALEVFGASPPIEILRQMMGNGGFYDRKIAGFWKEVQDVTVVAAAGPPEGGRNPVSKRLTRMFHLLQIPNLSDESMKRIFTSILSGFLDAHNFNREVKDLAKNMIVGSVELFQRIKEDLRPRPATPHYTYNLRDLAKVCQGLMQVIPRVCNNGASATRLWVHENMRCLHDRLTNATDRRFFTEEVVMDVLKRLFPGTHSHEEYFEKDPLIWGDFMRMGAAEKVYEESTDIKKIFRLFDEYLDDYNAVALTSKEGARSASMNLVFFLDHCKHLARIIRIIRQPRGNALLVGVGGSGKRSLSRLAAHIADFKRFEITVGKGYSMADFHESLLELYRLAGVKCQPVVFILSDDQIIHEGMLEDVNNILNSGEVPSLFPPDERDKMINSSAEAAREKGITHRDEIYNYFIARARDNMHVVLCMSPIGDAFRTRCRQFPSLTNCCSIDWFDEWPAEALHGVANRLLSGMTLEKNDEDRDKIISLCVDVHTCVEQFSEEFWNQLRRRYYITPTSYLEFLNLFVATLEEKTVEQKEYLSRFVNGREKMKETDSMIAVMKKDIEEKQPLLEKASKQAIEVVADLKVRREKASIVQQDVAGQQAEASQQQKHASGIASQAESRLAEAKPVIEEAQKALDTVKAEHINELKVLNNGPKGAVLTCQAVMTFFDPKDMPGWSGASDWKGCREFLAVKGLLNIIKNYDVDNVKPTVITRIQKYVLDTENFNPDEVRKRGSEVCGPLCSWVLAVDKYAALTKEVAPLKAAAAEASATLAATTAKLTTAKASLKEVEDELAHLQKNYDDTMSRKELLEKELAVCTTRLKNAVQLSDSLKNEGGRWEENIIRITKKLDTLPINVFLSCATMAYCGAFTPSFRKNLIAQWVLKVQEKGFNLSEFSLVDAMGDPMDTLTWQIAGLPTDDTSTENAIMVMNANPPRRWPLLIDPQGQGVKWLTNMQKRQENFKVVKMSDKGYLRIIEMAIEQGKTVLLADVGETLDPALEPLLNRQIYSHDGGDAQIQMSRVLNYRSSFRFFIATKMANPHYLPDVSTKVTLVNFTVTMDGLENQMLGEVVSIEKRELEEENNRITKSVSDGQKSLKEMEENILKRLKNVQGNILDDDELISTLKQTQIDAAIISKNQEEASKKIEGIRKVREVFRGVARRSALLYFVLADLSLIDPMYQYSLDYFKKLVRLVIQNEKIEYNEDNLDEVDAHLSTLTEGITETTYVQICRGLFNKDKTILSLLMCTSIARDAKEVTEAEWQFFIRGPALVSSDIESKPAELEWASRQQWELIDTISRSVPAFIRFDKDVIGYSSAWDEWSHSDSPHETPLPDTSKPWEKDLTAFQKILVMRVFREEKLLFALSNYVRDQMGSRFIEPPPFNLERAHGDSSVNTPIVFILSQGSDPMNLLQSFANLNHKTLQYVSLGQGQGDNAKRLVDTCKKSGDWALLQNCHLSKTFMPELENQVSLLNDPSIHPEFRLWLTSTPAPFFPVFVLQNSIKLTNEAPTGLKANMVRCFNEIHEGDYEVFGADDTFPECSKEHAYKKLIYGLCFFHSVVLERKKFGPLGWNVLYEWNDTDFHVSKQWLRLFFEEQAHIPWDSLEYIIGQINYGGRVTDPQDRGTLMTVLRIYLNRQLLMDGYSFSESGRYCAPDTGSLSNIREFLQEMSLVDDPEVFGMHENANLRYQLQVSTTLMSTVLSIQPRLVGSKGEGLSPEELVVQKAKDFEETLPEEILDEEAGPNSFTLLANGLPNSLSTVLSHEVVKYNKLLKQMRNSLIEIQKALQGLTVLSEDLDRMYTSFINDQVPSLWSSVGYASLKPLGAWFRDLVDRITFIRTWVRKGEPVCFWMGGFFNPSAFMTGMLQAFARAEGVSVDRLGFSYHVVEEDSANIAEQPRRGCFVSGIVTDAWRWDSEKGVMADSLPGVPYSMLPVLHFLPEANHKRPPNYHSVPMYRTIQRAGVISSLGASSNYVLSIEVPTDKDCDYWVLMGAACVTALNV